MTATMRIKRFTVPDRIYHLLLMVTFLVQTATGFSRLFITTGWGKALSNAFGGYESALLIHKWVGVLMMVGFVIHTLHLLYRIDWKNLRASLWGPDSLVPNFQDFKHFGQRIRWFFGGGPPPKLDRWTYWEKFDYWAVYWGLPLLALTGLMLMFPIWTSRWMPGWMLNVAVLLHRAEALLAVTYIFIVHFFIGHLRPSSFPMNEAMFAGSVPIDEVEEEKQAWVKRLKQHGGLANATVGMPATWFRIAYFIFGYVVLIGGVYLLFNGIVNSRSIILH